MSALQDAPRLDSERTTADLRFCGEQFESIRSDVSEFAMPLAPVQLEWRPNAATWSIAECIEHLSVTIEHDLVRLGTLIALTRALHLTRLGPLRSRSHAPTIAVHESPRASLASIAAARSQAPPVSAEIVVGRFLALNRRLLDVIGHAASLSARLPQAHAGSILLDMVSHTLQLNALHHWRYILQARRVTEFPGFPRR